MDRSAVISIFAWIVLQFTAVVENHTTKRRRPHRDCRIVPSVAGWMYFMFAFILLLFCVGVIYAMHLCFNRRRRPEKHLQSRWKRTSSEVRPTGAWSHSRRGKKKAAAPESPRSKSLTSEQRSKSDGYEVVHPRMAEVAHEVTKANPIRKPEVERVDGSNSLARSTISTVSKPTRSND